MSGHNPHSHLSQPNSSWNPLQIPSYIPRQPQLAHMSNERPLVRSPLTWHTPTTPTPPEAFYSFLSANHKNLELNPLLPTFVRGPSPFGSVDLTIQSARNSTTPSPRNLSSSPPPDLSVHNKQQQQQQQQQQQSSLPAPHQAPSSSISQQQQQQQQIPPSLASNNLNSSSLLLGTGVIQSTGSVREKLQSNSNGNNGDITPQPGSIFVRDARQINDEIAKTITSRNTMEVTPTATAAATTTTNNEPVELIKEGSYQSIKAHAAMPTSPKRLSPTRPSSIPNNTPVSPRSESPLTTLINTGSTTDIVNNHITKVGVHKSSTETAVVSDNSPLSLAIPPSPATATSNEDSLDSNASKSRRKRKPNKTTRVTPDSDESLQGTGETGTDTQRRQQNINPSKIQEILDKVTKETEDNSSKMVSEIQRPIGITQNLDIPSTPASPDANESSPEQLTIPKPPESNSMPSRHTVESTSPKSPETLNQTPETELKSSSPDRSNAKSSCHDQPAIGKLQNEKTDTNDDKPRSVAKSENDNLDSPRKRSKRKGDSDDIETIDKIAAMIASTNDDAVASLSMELTPENSTVGKDDAEKIVSDAAKIETENAESKITDLTELLGTPVGVNCLTDSTIVDNLTKDDGKTKPNVENCFEEVENKLEEMFAGIEDEGPTPCIVPSVVADLIDDAPSATEVITELGLGLQSPMKNKSSSASTTPPESVTEISVAKHPHSPSSQKRSHSSNKSDSVPPKKKPKIAKKPHNNQKSGKFSKSAPSSSHNNSLSSKSLKLNDKTAGGSKEKPSKDETSTVDYKGPFVHIKSDGSINVINAPIAEDVVEKQNKVKKLHNHTHSDRNKIRGLHVSTLSTKYDADTADATWMCVFCKRGPHKQGLGDLFGPYIITTTCEGFAYSQKDPNDDEFISKRTKSEMYQKHINGMPAVPAATSSLGMAVAAAAATVTATTTKKKRKISESPNLQNTVSPRPLQSPSLNTIEDIYVGMIKVSDTSYEVWLHEDCVVWSPGVYIIGARIVGLDTAVWSSTRYKCNVCSKNGAMISCLQRGCTDKAHIPCARNANWALDECGFNSTCDKHCTLS